ncbi:MAG: hypothetical protein QNJ84_17275 [Alphaproteobacteria bacterium]|nr:hypothetical protein [Alphaproteobacteria bacterium]
MTATDNQLHKDIGALTASVGELKREIAGLKKDVSALTAQANRWKGAFVVLLAAGGVVGWLSDRVLKFIHS